MGVQVFHREWLTCDPCVVQPFPSRKSSNASIRSCEVASIYFVTHNGRMALVYPDPFLEVRTQHLSDVAPGISLCAAYEGGEWRAKELANHLFQWLPFVALNQEHQLAFSGSNFVELLQVASAHIYKTKKTESRGELGELLLHLACVLNYGTVPVLCKLLLKTSSNDTVKGFDGVHVLVIGSQFEIWLGESKFYTNAQVGIRDAIKSLQEHILPSFLATEKAMVLGHIGPDIPNRDKLLELFRRKSSSDELLAMATFPILIAYESTSVQSHTQLCDEYVEALTYEVEGLRSYFGEKASELKLRFQLIFVPMASKAAVVESFDKKLEAFL
jgi:hypothetical protein